MPGQQRRDTARQARIVGFGHRVGDDARNLRQRRAAGQQSQRDIAQYEWRVSWSDGPVCPLGPCRHSNPARAPGQTPAALGPRGVCSITTGQRARRPQANRMRTGRRNAPPGAAPKRPGSCQVRSSHSGPRHPVTNGPGGAVNALISNSPQPGHQVLAPADRARCRYRQSAHHWPWRPGGHGQGWQPAWRRAAAFSSPRKAVKCI